MAAPLFKLSPTFRRPATLTAGALVAMALAVGPTTAVAAPKPTESQLRAELKKLNQKIDKLLESYNAKRVQLAKAQKAEKSAKERLVGADAALTKGEAQAAEIAQLRYQATDGGLPALLFSPTVDSAILLEQLATEQDAVLQGIADARASQKQAADEAVRLTDEIELAADEVKEQRGEAEDLIGEIKEKLEDLVPYGTGRRSDGSWAPELPSGSDNITPRTALMREQVRKNFTLQFSVGCYRVDDSGEHPLGRACDFMMSGGGSSPSAENDAVGDRLATWAIKNKEKLGIKYVIWKQRINQGSGWRGMSNRGSVTANHYDHVHISMY